LAAIVHFFLELCLLRRAPQDLPASPALLIVTLLADLMLSMMFGTAAGLSVGMSLTQSLLDIGFMLALLYAALRVSNHLARFQQSATALLGSGALLELFAMVPLGLLPPGQEGQATGGTALLFLALIFWGILVAGHIIRHVFELRLAQGVAISLLYHFLAYSLVGGLLTGA